MRRGILVKPPVLASDRNPVQSSLSKTRDQLIWRQVWLDIGAETSSSIFCLSFSLDLFTWLCLLCNTSLVSSSGEFFSPVFLALRLLQGSGVAYQWFYPYSWISYDPCGLHAHSRTNNWGKGWNIQILQSGTWGPPPWPGSGEGHSGALTLWEWEVSGLHRKIQVMIAAEELEGCWASTNHRCPL